MARSAATIRLMSEQEDISRSRKVGDEASSGHSDGPSIPSRESGDRAPAAAEQSVLKSSAPADAEGRSRGGLVDLMARISPEPVEVHEAWMDLRSMIEEVVRREFQWLEARIAAKLDGVKSELKALRAECVKMWWLLGILAAECIALYVVVISMFIFLATH